LKPTLQFRNLITLLFILMVSASTYCQDWESVIGRQYILRFQDSRSAEQFFRNKNELSRSDQPIAYTKIMSAPLELWLAEFSASADIKGGMKIWDFAEGLIHVTPNRLISERKVPDDPDFNRQWQYINDGSSNGLINADMDMDLAWEITTGGLTTTGDTIVICIIDSGINGSHPDLVSNIWKNRFEIPGNGIDDDGNGFTDDFLGWNAVDQNDAVYNNSNHGSSVAGIAGAKGNNGIGVAGVNWNVKMMIVNYGRPTEANALASYAYPYAMRKMYNESGGSKGAFVVATNASWGLDKTKPEDAPIWCALYDSLGMEGILNCGATINEGVDVDVVGDMPTACESEFLISVTNLNRADQKVGGAGFGAKSIDLGAYGHLVYTTTSGGYGTFGGTSAATPHVAGTIGLAYATSCDVLASIAKADPAASALIVKDMILHGVTLNNSLKQITTTGGRLNVHRALENVLQLCENCTPPAGIYFVSEDEGTRVYWSNNTGDAKINLRYRKENTQQWITIPDIGNGAFMSSLDYCTVYEVQLGSDCGRLPGEFSYSKYFTTAKCCNKPGNIRLNAFKDTIKVSWNYPEYYGSFNLEYRPFGGEWEEISVSVNEVDFSEFSECTLWQFRVSNICEETNASSQYTEIAEISSECGACTATEYCRISRVDASQEWIEKIKIGDRTFISGQPKNGYSYLLGAAIFELEEKSKIPVEITPGFAGQSFDEFYKVYVDLNQNGQWEADDLVFFNSESRNNVVQGEMVIPEGITEGFTRMRVIMTYDSFPGACDHPKFEFGEAEDYCVFLKRRPCPEISGVKINPVDTTKAFFEFDYSNYQADSIRLDYRSAADQAYISLIIRDTSFLITDLDSCTDYEFTVRTFCRGSLRDDGTGGTFRTACSSSAYDISGKSFPLVYPNPFNDGFFLRLPDDWSSSKTISLISINGTEVKCSLKSEAKKGEYSVTPESRLSAGIYLLKIISSKGIDYLRVVKI
jgi:serine protease